LNVLNWILILAIFRSVSVADNDFLVRFLNVAYCSRTYSRLYFTWCLFNVR